VYGATGTGKETIMRDYWIRMLLDDSSQLHARIQARDVREIESRMARNPAIAHWHFMTPEEIEAFEAENLHLYWSKNQECQKEQQEVEVVHES
jgi:hypothetical protein